MVWFVFVALMSAAGTYAVRWYALQRSIVDIPNERSSHTTATPRGGGVAVVVSFFAGLVWLWLDGGMEDGVLFALLSVLPIVIVSLIDDMVSLSARVRMGVQTFSAVLALVALGGVNALHLGFFELEGLWINFFAFLAIVWMTNLYNFLDGIDGYAGSEAVFAGAGAYLLFGSEAGLLIAAAALGFLLFNWHKASIFMGDVGSAPLGFVFAVLALHDASEPSFLGWVTLLSLFWFDATVTLLRRFKKGEKLSQAHKKHMYQRLHQAGFPHDRVVLMGMGLNGVLLLALWIFPPPYYGVVFCASLLLLWAALKYVDSKKAFS